MYLPDIPEAAIWAIYFAPLASFVLIVLFLWQPRTFGSLRFDAGRLTIALIALSWVLSLWALDSAIGHSAITRGGEPIIFGPHEWFAIFDFKFEIGVRLDGLSAMMLVVVTSISLLVQIYSTGYMAGDTGYSRFFAFMSLFTMSMLGLVMASNLLQLFVHWELVGVTSYLLIGFWFHKPEAAAAAKKAFIVTRFGDFAFLVAVVLIWTKLGTFDIAEINIAVSEPGFSSAVLAGFVLGLFSGAVGKSAQFPLHFWLPDAMEGPTPVSSIGHSATMVAAGVYLLARFFPAVEAAPSEVGWTIAYIGGFTALFAATIAVTATDIKRVLAYSTISQLGYMVMVIGLGGYVAAAFHLFTHAFFKSLLFWGAGSVSHATNTFEMPKMGGLRSVMPMTFATFLVGALSLAGVFPLAGFWSKDEILLDAWNESKLLWVVGTAVAFLTALYIFRAIFMTFFGEYKGGAAPAPGEHGNEGEPHESPRSMIGPMVVGAVVAVVAGFLALGGRFGEFIEASLEVAPAHAFEFETEGIVVVASTVAALAGIAVAAAIYYQGTPSAARLRAAFGPFGRLVERNYYIDEIAEGVVVRGVFQGGIVRAADLFDRYVVDGIVNAAATITRLGGDALRRSETGQPQAYTSIYFIGLLLAVIVIFVVSGGVLER